MEQKPDSVLRLLSVACDVAQAAHLSQTLPVHVPHVILFRRLWDVYILLTAVLHVAHPVRSVAAVELLLTAAHPAKSVATVCAIHLVSAAAV